jgi:hypothetical protein
VAYWSARFQNETRTTSFLVSLLVEMQVPCERCGQRTGRCVLVKAGGQRSFVCDICVARTPEFEARLAERMEQDKALLDRIAEGPNDGR